MQNVRKTLLSAAAGMATTGLAHAISDWDVDVLLRPMGLMRRRSAWPQNLALVGAGIFIGGVTALLLAPASGQETRAKLAANAEKLGDSASNQLREVGEQVRREVDALRPGNNQASVEQQA
jgi:hypothetical protein